MEIPYPFTQTSFYWFMFSKYLFINIFMKNATIYIDSIYIQNRKYHSTINNKKLYFWWLLNHSFLISSPVEYFEYNLIFKFFDLLEYRVVNMFLKALSLVYYSFISTLFTVLFLYSITVLFQTYIANIDELNPMTYKSQSTAGWLTPCIRNLPGNHRLRTQIELEKITLNYKKYV